jgi:hypothetical protein
MVDLGVELAPQPRRSQTRKAQGEGAPSPAAERGYATVAQQGGTERIRHHQATFLGDQHLGKVVWNRKIEAIREIAVGYPLSIGAEIGYRAFDLDDHKVASPAEAEDIGAPSVGEGKFYESGVAELVERAANPSREEHPGR